MFEELVELVPDGETREDGVVDQGGPQVSQGAGGVESGVLETSGFEVNNNVHLI